MRVYVGGFEYVSMSSRDDTPLYSVEIMEVIDFICENNINKITSNI